MPLAVSGSMSESGSAGSRSRPAITSVRSTMPWMAAALSIDIVIGPVASLVVIETRLAPIHASRDILLVKRTEAMPFAAALDIFAPAGDISALVKATIPGRAAVPCVTSMMISVAPMTVIRWASSHASRASESVKRTDAMPLAKALLISSSGSSGRSIRSLARFTMPLTIATSTVISVGGVPTTVMNAAQAVLVSASVKSDEATPLAASGVRPPAIRVLVRLTMPTTASSPYGVRVMVFPPSVTSTMVAVCQAFCASRSVYKTDAMPLAVLGSMCVGGTRASRCRAAIASVRSTMPWMAAPLSIDIVIGPVASLVAIETRFAAIHAFLESSSV